MSKEHEKIANRLTAILQKLNQSERLKIDELMAEFGVSKRTIQRDINERFAFLPIEFNDNAYTLSPSYLGKFNLEDINRFAIFASIRELFGRIDQNFFQKYLNDSIEVKGFDYEPLGVKQKEFNIINQAIQDQKRLTFSYQRVKDKEQDRRSNFDVEPYKLVNKNGIWYLIALHDSKIKVFSVTRISSANCNADEFTPDKAILSRIENGDGIYFEGVIEEIVLKISAEVAVYFTRRAILPNQTTIKELLDGTLIVMCQKVHEQEILPLVRYWIPHVEIINPPSMKIKLMSQLQQYMDSPIMERTD